MELVHDHCSNEICGNAHPLCSECITKTYELTSKCPFCRQSSQKYKSSHMVQFNLATGARPFVLFYDNSEPLFELMHAQLARMTISAIEETL